MTTHRYELTMSPNEALRALEAAPELAALKEGELWAGGARVGGTATFELGQVRFRAWYIKSFQVVYPLTARIQLDLSASRGGCTFTVQRDAPKLHSIGEFRSVIVVALITFVPLAFLYLPLAAIVASLQALVVGAVWWNKRRGVKLATETVLGIVWRAWGHAMRSDAPGLYRGHVRQQPVATPL